MLYTYAKYNFTYDWKANKIGEGWHLVTNEQIIFTPSGKHTYVTINGMAVKAKFCTIIQVFTK